MGGYHDKLDALGTPVSPMMGLAVHSILSSYLDSYFLHYWRPRGHDTCRLHHKEMRQHSTVQCQSVISVFGADPQR